MAAPDDAALPAALPADADGSAVVSAFADTHATRLRRAGRFAGLGYPVEWIASRFGMDVSTVRKWQRDPAYLEGYASAEGQAARDASLALSKIALSLPALVDTSLAVALDTTHKDSSVERRYLIDKVLIPMSVQHTTTEHRADERFWGPVAAALERVAATKTVDVPVLLDGPAAAADYGAAKLPAAAEPAVPPPSDPSVGE